jgi:hypothetical protein
VRMIMRQAERVGCVGLFALGGQRGAHMLRWAYT